ncbi:hypothetical protein APHAL10511_002148 [Amanita phalloides]|nr:hypothetical protein APHAL10511_002148 [Amanita phalloides]
MANSYKLIHDALEANKTHQAELVKYAQDLAAEIQELDNLLDNDNVLDSITSISEPCTTIQIRGGSKPVSIDSPFYPEASCQARYNRNTVPHQIKGKELDALTDAVQRERQRVQKLKRPRFSEQEIHNNELNWTAIAERVGESLNNVIPFPQVYAQVSAVYSNVRTADECRIKFEASSRNKEPTTHEGTRQHHVWSTEFDKKLMEAVERYGFNNWMIGRVTFLSPPTCAEHYKLRDTSPRTPLLVNVRDVILVYSTRL